MKTIVLKPEPCVGEEVICNGSIYKVAQIDMIWITLERHVGDAIETIKRRRWQIDIIESPDDPQDHNGDINKMVEEKPALEVLVFCSACKDVKTANYDEIKNSSLICNECKNKMSEQEEQKPALKLKPGIVCKRRDGYNRSIKDRTSYNKEYPWETDSGMFYKENGECSEGYQYDLIEEVQPETVREG